MPLVLVDETDLPGDPWFDVALAIVLLRSGLEHGNDILRVHRPVATAAFSRRDTRRTGFGEAAKVARMLGFAPVVRPQGGRLAAYHQGSLVIDHVVRVANPHEGLAGRFEHYAALHAAALASIGVDVRIGEVPGEYCPGEFSLNVAGAHKVAGSAQRVTREGWLLSTVIQVSGSAPTRKLLSLTHAALGYDFDPATVGALEDFAPVTWDAVRGALVDGYGAEADVSEARLPSELLNQAVDERRSYRA